MSASAENSVLSGKTILVTRAQKQSEEFKALLEKFGAHVIIFPVIKIQPVSSWVECDRVIKKIQEYDGVLFTSVNAVENFVRRMEETASEKINILQQKVCYVVGERTRQEAENSRLTIKESSMRVDGESLGREIIKESVNGKKFLFPKGNLANNVLPDMLRYNGATVDDVVVYETTKPNDSDIQLIENLLKQQKIDVVTFFSPSSVQNFFLLVSSARTSSLVFAVIGETTAQALGEIHVSVDIIAPQPTSDALTKAIVKFYSLLG